MIGDNMLKVKQGFMLREVSGVYCVVPVGEANKEFKGLIRLNSTAGYMFELMQEGITYDELVEKVLSEYDAPKEQIEHNANNIINALKSHNILEDE